MPPRPLLSGTLVASGPRRFQTKRFAPACFVGRGSSSPAGGRVLLRLRLFPRGRRRGRRHHRGRGRRRRPARERADHAPVGVEERERHGAGRLVLEPVVHDDAAGRVRARVEQLLDLLARRRLHLAVRVADRAGQTIGDLAGRTALRAVALVRAPAHGAPRREQMRGALHVAVGHLVQRRQVVEDPERAAVRGHHEVGVLHDQVVDRHDRQVAAQALPRAAVVERDPHAAFGARVEQTAPVRILADRARDLSGRDAVGDALPRPAVVVGLEQVGMRIGELVAGRRHVAGGRVVRRRLDHADQRPLGQVGRRHPFPRPAAIAREVHEAVVGARPQHVALVRRLDEREDRAVDLGARVVARDRPAGARQPGRIVPREVGARDLPALALVHGAEHAIAGDPQFLGVPARVEHRERPLKAVAMLGRRRAHAVRLRPHADHPLLAGAMVVVDQAPVAGAGADGAAHDDVRIAGLHRDVAALAAAGLHPLRRRDGAAMRVARHPHRPVVLLRAVDVVRLLVVRAHVVELRGRLVVDRRPRLPAVEAHARAAVVGLDHPPRVLRIDPEVVVVAVRRGELAERLAAVGRFPQRVVRDPDRVHVLRIREHVHVVPGTSAQPRVFADALPRRARVVRAEQRAVVGFHHRVHAPAVRGRHDDADAPEHAARQTGVAGDVGPRVAAVGGLPQPGVGTAARHAPRRAPRLPDGREHHARVVGIEREVDRARVLALEQHVRPGGAAVARAEHAALAARAPGVPERRHVDEVRVARMHAHAPDVPRVAQSDVRPRRAAVRRAIDAVAVRHVPADARFAGAGVHDVAVGRGDVDRADRGGLEEAVGDVLPVGAAIRRLPHAAGAGAEIERHRVGRMAGDGHGAAAAEGTDGTPGERLEQCWVDGHGRKPSRLVTWGVRDAPPKPPALRSPAEPCRSATADFTDKPLVASAARNVVAPAGGARRRPR